MYSTNLHDQLINAALPLKPLTTWSGGACTVTVAVPPTQSTVGVSIDSVRVELSLPSGQTASAEAVNVEDTPNWVATFPADLFATSGFVAQGLTVYMGGTDEHSTERVWIISKGDLEVKPGDASPSPTGSFVVVKLRDSAPTTPVKGDAYIGGGTLYIFDGSAWQEIGGSSVEIDPTLTQQGAAADAKATGDALKGKLDGAAAYPAWLEAGIYYAGDIVSYNGLIYRVKASVPGTTGTPPDESADWEGVTVQSLIAAKANTTDMNAALALKANAADLRYALVTPGEWAFSGDGVQSGKTYTVEYEGPGSEPGTSIYLLKADGYAVDSKTSEVENPLSLYFYQSDITATRASLPDHLLDRAVNNVAASSATVFTLPASVPGYARDFLLRLVLAGSSVPSISFAAPTGETIAYEYDGDAFPVPDETGTWWYSFTEGAPGGGVFAVALKKVNTVTQQGGAS